MTTIAVTNALVIKLTTEEVARAVAVPWKTRLTYRKSLSKRQPSLAVKCGRLKSSRPDSRCKSVTPTKKTAI